MSMTVTINDLQEDIDFLEKELYNANFTIDVVVKILTEAGTHIGSVKKDMALLRRYKETYGDFKD